MKTFKGLPGAPGIAGGRAIYFHREHNGKAKLTFDEAIDRAAEEISLLYDKAMAEVGEEGAKIFEAYRMLLEDEMLTAPMRDRIATGESVSDAVSTVAGEMSQRLAAKENKYLRQRAEDIRYIGDIILGILNGKSRFSLPEGEDRIILLAEELTPVDTLSLETDRIAGIATEKGGITSHTIMLAKSLGIPAVVGTQDMCFDGIKNAYIDGYSGLVVLDPDAETEQKMQQYIHEEADFRETLKKLEGAECRTADGKRISLYINIGEPSDTEGTDRILTDGIGLFRTEFLYSYETKEPSVSMQIEKYSRVFNAFKGKPVTIRTIDVGGDKIIDYLHMLREDNPFLGTRGIRLCFRNKDVFSNQLEAILTAAAGREARIMLPMITSPSEVDEAREIIKRVCEDLDKRGTEHCRNPLIGVMIETPAAAEISDILAKKCDFFSIGTNDLVQYITAADRCNPDVVRFYDPYNPAVVRMLKKVIENGKAAGIDVSVCGDLASSPEYVPILLGLGLEKFSVPLPMAARIKHTILSTDIKTAKQAADDALIYGD